jgi:tetratricopeptide (TPR) repeat protein
MPFDETLLLVAVQLYEEARFEEAAALAKQALDESPDNGRLWEIYGTARCQLEDFEVACDALETASVLVALHPVAQVALAACYVRANRTELACLIYRHLAVTVTNTGLLSKVAARLGALEKHSAALKVCRRIVDLDSGHHQAIFGIAYYLRRLGFSSGTILPHLEMALKLSPDNLTYRLNLAFALFDIDCDREAHETLKPVALEAVSSPCCLQRMRQIFDRAGDHARALLCRVRLACVQQ